MRRAGLVVWQSHQAASRLLKVGVTTAELNQVYRDTFAKFSATSLFLGYGPEDNPFPAEACISINDEVVHGVPGSRTIKDGDIVSFDTGCSIGGWCADAAVTLAVGDVSQSARSLMQLTQQTLDLAIELLGKCKTWSEVAVPMQDLVEQQGHGVVTELTGHGIGKELHEPPQVPNYWDNDFKKQDDFDIRPGVVIAIEPMVNVGSGGIAYQEDGWTVLTEDNELSAHFEHTVAITGEGPVRLTAAPAADELELVGEAFRDPAKWVRW